MDLCRKAKAPHYPKTQGDVRVQDREDLMSVALMATAMRAMDDKRD